MDAQIFINLLKSHMTRKESSQKPRLTEDLVLAITMYS